MDVVVVSMLQTVVSRDSMSPHQISHTEIFKSLIVWEVGNGSLQDELRGGIWCAVIIPRPVPLAGTTSPDIGIRGRVMRGKDMRRTPSRDVIKVANIARRVGRHQVMVGDDGIVL